MTLLSAVVLHGSFVHGVALCCEVGNGMDGRNGDTVFVVVVAVVVVKDDTEDESLLEATTDDT